MTTYNQVDWQEVVFSGTILGVPTDDLDITANYLGGDDLSYKPYQEAGATTGEYRVRLAPIEIESGASVTIEYTCPTANFDTPNSVVTLTDPATLDAGDQYCEVFDIYLKFGSENVNKWADLNNLRNTEEIARTIINQIVLSTDYIDTMLTGFFDTIPFAAPYPPQIVDACRINAGVNLQLARGIEDDDTTFDNLRMKADTMLKRILAGQIRLGLATADAPGDQDVD